MSFHIRSRADKTRSRWVVAMVVTGCLLLAVLIGPTLGIQLARVEGEAMAPTLAGQDRIVVNRWAYLLSSPGRGDVVMFRYPADPRRSFVKRVIGMPGDTIRIDDGRVYVNEVPLDDVAYVPAPFRSHDSHGPQVVPQGHYFVLGDHRNNSSDSRHWGVVPEKYILGRVALRWWPTAGFPH